MRLFALSGTLALATIVAAQAQAATFCVQKPACVNQGGTSVPTLGSAIASAGVNGGGRDLIEVGPGTFTDGPFNAVDGNPVNIVGSGPGKTVLTRTSSTDGGTILTLADGASRAAKLRVQINEGQLVRGIRTAGALQRIRVGTQNAELNQTGVLLDPGSSLVRGRIAFPVMGPSASGMSVLGPAAVRQTTIRAPLGMFGASLAGKARATRMRITANTLGVSVTTGRLVLDQATVRLLSTAAGNALSASSGGTNATTLTARHVTAVGARGTSTVGAVASALAAGPGPGDCPRATVVLRNSILRAFATDLSRSEFALSCSGPAASADINLAWSVFDPASAMESGDGAIVDGAGNRNVNPRFVKQATGNYHLKPSSPLIDRGQRGRPGPGESKRDLDGRKRVLDGDGNGRARRDVGAFERPRRR